MPMKPERESSSDSESESSSDDSTVSVESDTPKRSGVPPRVPPPKPTQTQAKTLPPPKRPVITPPAKAMRPPPESSESDLSSDSSDEDEDPNPFNRCMRPTPAKGDSGPQRSSNSQGSNAEKEEEVIQRRAQAASNATKPQPDTAPSDTDEESSDEDLAAQLPPRRAPSEDSYSEEDWEPDEKTKSREQVEAEEKRRREAEAEAEEQRRREEAEAEAEEKRRREAEAEAEERRRQEAEAEAEQQRRREAEAEAEERRRREAEAEAEQQQRREAEAEAEEKRRREAEAEERRRQEAEAEAEQQQRREAEAEAEEKRRREAEAEAEQQRRREAEAVRPAAGEAPDSDSDGHYSDSFDDEVEVEATEGERVPQKHPESSPGEPVTKEESRQGGIKDDSEPPKKTDADDANHSDDHYSDSFDDEDGHSEKEFHSDHESHVAKKESENVKGDYSDDESISSRSHSHSTSSSRSVSEDRKGKQEAETPPKRAKQQEPSRRVTQLRRDVETKPPDQTPTKNPEPVGAAEHPKATSLGDVMKTHQRAIPRIYGTPALRHNNYLGPVKKEKNSSPHRRGGAESAPLEKPKRLTEMTDEELKATLRRQLLEMRKVPRLSRPPKPLDLRPRIKVLSLTDHSAVLELSRLPKGEEMFHLNLSKDEGETYVKVGVIGSSIRMPTVELSELSPATRYYARVAVASNGTPLSSNATLLGPQQVIHFTTHASKKTFRGMNMEVPAAELSKEGAKAKEFLQAVELAFAKQKRKTPSPYL